MTPRRRRYEQNWWTRNRKLLVYVALFTIAAVALAREEQLRRDTEHDVRHNVIVQIQKTQHQACIEQNRARSAANDSSRALRSFIEVIIKQAEKRLPSQHGRQRDITLAGLALYHDLADHQHIIKLVDCP